MNVLGAPRDGFYVRIISRRVEFHGGAPKFIAAIVAYDGFYRLGYLSNTLQLNFEQWASCGSHRNGQISACQLIFLIFFKYFYLLVLS